MCKNNNTFLSEYICRILCVRIVYIAYCIAIIVVVFAHSHMYGTSTHTKQFVPSPRVLIGCMVDCTQLKTTTMMTTTGLLSYPLFSPKCKHYKSSTLQPYISFPKFYFNWTRKYQRTVLSKALYEPVADKMLISKISKNGQVKDANGSYIEKKTIHTMSSSSRIPRMYVCVL